MTTKSKVVDDAIKHLTEIKMRLEDAVEPMTPDTQALALIAGLLPALKNLDERISTLESKTDEQ